MRQGARLNTSTSAPTHDDLRIAIPLLRKTTYTVAMTNRCVPGLNGKRANGGGDAESTGLPDAGFVNSDCPCFYTSTTPISIPMTYLVDRIRS